MQAPKDQNYVPCLLGTSKTDKLTPIPVYVDYSTNSLYVDALISTGDIQIGTVEIKNSTDDTRAVVGANGLEVVVNETIPTDTTKVNASLGLAYDGSGNLITLTKVIGGVTYTKTLTYVANVLTNVGAWS